MATYRRLGADFDLGRVLRYGAVSPRLDERRARSSKPTRSSICGKKSGPRPWSAICPASPAFLPVAALFNGQVVNVAGIARDAGVAGRLRP